MWTRRSEGNNKRRSVHAIKILPDPNPVPPRWASMTSFKPSFGNSLFFFSLLILHALSFGSILPCPWAYGVILDLRARNHQQLSKSKSTGYTILMQI